MKKINRRDFIKYGTGILSSLTLASSFPNCSDFDDIIGPYLQNVTEHRVTVCWIDHGGGELKFKGDKKRTLEYHLGFGDVINHVQLKNLEAGKTYEYSVDGKKRSFRTKPNIKEPFNFVIYGDIHIEGESATSEKHRKLIKQIKKLNPSFIVQLGDIVDKGKSFESWKLFLDDIEPISGSIPYYFTIGNHEYYPKGGNFKENSKNYFKLFALPGKERYYTLEWGDCRFIFLDSTKLLRHSKLHQLDYLSNKMKGDKMNIVIPHHPIYGAKKKEAKLKDIFGDRLDKADLVLSGHRHSYRRRLVNDTTYIVSGGGGASLGPIEDKETLDFYAKRHHFINVDVGEKLEFTVIGKGGDIIDSFSLKNKFWQ